MAFNLAHAAMLHCFFFLRPLFAWRPLLLFLVSLFANFDISCHYAWAIWDDVVYSDTLLYGEVDSIFLLLWGLYHSSDSTGAGGFIMYSMTII